MHAGPLVWLEPDLGREISALLFKVARLYDALAQGGDDDEVEHRCSL